MPSAAPKKKPAASVKPSEPAPELTPEMLAFLHVFALGCGKIGYKHADAAIELLQKKKPKGAISIPADVSLLIPSLIAEFEKFASTIAGKKFKFVDCWRGKSKMNTGSNVRRYELEELASL